MECGKCHNEIAGEDKFCGFCGEKNITFIEYYKSIINIDQTNFIQGVSHRKQLYKQIHKNYINSSIWKNVKIKLANIYKQNNWPIKCIKCGTIHNLQYHHNYYIDIDCLGNENISDVDYLCAKCHDDWHSVQKTLGLFQNNSFYQYYNFIISDLDSSDFTEFKRIFLGKIKIDNCEIINFYSRDDVVKYQKVVNIELWLLFISFILIFALGIGIIFIVIIYFAFSKVKAPENYNIYEKRNKSIEMKNTFIKYLNAKKLW